MVVKVSEGRMEREMKITHLLLTLANLLHIVCMRVQMRCLERMRYLAAAMMSLLPVL